MECSGAQADENRRLIKEKEATEEVFRAPFEVEYKDLRSQDWHLMEMGHETVLNKMASEQCTWLHNIRIAWEIGVNELDTTTSQLREDVARWLGRGH